MWQRQGGYPLTFWHPIFLQLLWDLELLAGVGLGLFWPLQAQFCGLRGQAQCARSQHSEACGRVGGVSEQLMSGVSGAWLRQGRHCDVGAIIVVRRAGGAWALETDGSGSDLCSDTVWTVASIPSATR